MPFFKGRRNDDEVIDLRADDERPTLAQLDDMEITATRADQYSDWAERMRTKREARRQQLFGGQPEATATYWSQDQLYEESRRVEEEELTTRPDPRRVAELLAVFGLEADASADQVGAAFRKLAKTHHPDRYVSADEETRGYHAERMRHVNATYRALKDLDRA